MDMQLTDSLFDPRAGSCRDSHFRSRGIVRSGITGSWRHVVRLQPDRARKLAQLEFLCGGMRNTLSLFLLLWERRNEFVTYEEITTSYVSSRQADAPVASIAYSVNSLRKLIRRKGWPLSLSNARSKGYAILLEDSAWTWETDSLLSEPEVEAAVTIMAISQVVPIRVGLLMGILWCRRNNTVTKTAISSRWKDIFGRRATQSGISEAVLYARTIIARRRWPMTIENVVALGYRLKYLGSDQVISAADNPDAEIFDFETVAAALDYLGATGNLLGQAFLVLWARRGSVVSFERLEEELYLATGEHVSREVMRWAVAKVRRCIAEGALPLSLTSFFGVGYRLDLMPTETPLPVPLTSILPRVEHAEIDRKARLADLFPALHSASLNVLQILIDAKGAVRSRADISYRCREMSGDNASYVAIRNRLVTIRAALRDAGAPAYIVTDIGEGWRLVGDLSSWVVSGGKAPSQAEPPRVVSPHSDSPTRVSRSVPIYRNHFARCLGSL